ncbi:Leucine-rich repeat domain, L domain-like [Phytophthora cactorum]|nr:Leucine-rich repeat domain, L domain-like [Phytophthora cactorum]
MQLGDEGLRTIATAILQGPVTQIQYLDISDNAIQSSIDTFARALAAGKLPHLLSPDNELGALEFEELGSALATNCCPRLQNLDLSVFLNLTNFRDCLANFARGEGIARFCPFLLSPPARYFGNEIPHRGLLRLNETLTHGNCKQLHELNLSCNSELKAIRPCWTSFEAKVCLLSLYCNRSEGYDLVQDTLRRRSVQELRRLKQLRFEEKLLTIHLKNDAKAERDQKRCRRQTQRLREVYDHLESEADQALRRRKKVKKSSQLHIHQEIVRQKQERASSN